jgi:hypothetical protein
MTPGHEDMNAAIRRAAGYAPAAPTQETMPVGDLGTGRGAGAAERRPEPPSFSSVIRAARAERNERIRELAVYFDGERTWVG